MLTREPTITNKKDLKKAELFVKSAQPLLLDTPESCTLSEHSLHHSAEQRRGQEGKSARRGDGATPSASPSRKLPPSKRPNLYPKNKNIKKDRQTNKVQQS